MSRTAQALLEFDRLIEIVRRQTTCAPGRRAVEALAPRTDRNALEEEFALVAEAVGYLRAGKELGFGSLADPEGWLARLQVPEASLAPADLLDAASLADTVRGLKQALCAEAAKWPQLAARIVGLGDFRALAAAIRRAILPNGEIADEASPQLARIRAATVKARERIQRQLRAILRARGAGAAEDYVTLRNDRYVIPVRAGERGEVAGVVHGASASGQTLFVEPLEAVEENNRLVRLAEEEANEISRILAELTARVRAERAPLAAAASAVADFDSFFARARFARAFDCAMPQFSPDNSLRLDAARHPVLQDSLRQHGRAVVPISLALGGAETMLVVSGPNTGGKTVALKTVGLAALAAQAGIPVAAECAILPMFDRVLADIGDEQSITADLSTFSAHMLNLNAMLEAATPRSLVLVDEIGTGTAPEEGAALAVAVLEEFRAGGCLVVATTHHDRLKAYASTTPGVVNAAVEFDEVQLRPTYRLRIGVPGASSGIAIAERLGLPRGVVERARRELSPEAREAAGLIRALHRSRDEIEEIERQARGELERLESERKALQTEWVERQRKRISELERRFAEELKRLEAEVARTVQQITDRQARSREEKQAGRRMTRLASEGKEEADAAVVAHLSEAQADLGEAARPAPAPPAPEQLVPGARVRVRGLPSPVVIRQRDDRSAEIQAGPLRMRVGLTDIVAVEAEDAAVPAPPRRVTVHADAGPADQTDEINVIGLTVEQASERVDKFLDQAALAARSYVRIIHGHGTGALRRGLAEFLAAHPLVERAHAETPERGGEAITVVELKS